ncbi:MAG: S1 RNA-binding domain-containing protein [Candidatus Yonathbacteria bacterium]|nr:S1 RNA-binding domain-containing protein [Candidatus Yonathbacteria bacterium]
MSELEKEKLVEIAPSLMTSLMEEERTQPEIDSLVEGPVLGIQKSNVYINLAPFGTGIIYGAEFINARDIIKKLNIGDIITAKVVDMDNKDGYIELSLKEARQALIWTEAEEAIKKKKELEITVKDANKGGLIVEWQGIQGFLPASQLKSEHYPRIEDGDKNKILNELKKLVGQKMSMIIISASPKEGKLIFSEKEQGQATVKEKRELSGKYSVGDELDGVISGIVDFGVFVKLEDGIEGLVHISEIGWGLIDDPRKIFKLHEKVRVKVIEIKDGKISLSIKALKDNPWKDAEKRYKKGDIVMGVVIKFNPYGALVSLEEGVAGLAHISEFETEENLKKTLELGKTYSFSIAFFDPKEQKMTLSYKK